MSYARLGADGSLRCLRAWWPRAMRRRSTASARSAARCRASDRRPTLRPGLPPRPRATPRCVWLPGGSRKVTSVARALLTGLVLLAAAACLGDRSAEVTVVNDTGRRITVYPYGRSQKELHWLLDPGTTYRANLLAGDAQPDTFVARIQAVDD